MIIEQTAPRSPDCFDSRSDWLSWLLLAHESGMRITRRCESGRSAVRHTWQEVLPLEQINYCGDCTSIHRARMERAHRCEKAIAEAAQSAVKELTMYEGIARSAHHIHRTYRMEVSSEPAGPVWEAMTTKERNSVVARCEAVHKALNAGKTAADIDEDRVMFEAVRWLLPAFTAIERAREHVNTVAKNAEEEQIGALLYIAAMVKRFGGETATVHMKREDMEAACELELMRYDEEDGGLILKVEPKEPVIEERKPVVIGAGSVKLDLTRSMNE